MAAGDIFRIVPTSTADAAYCDLKPASGEAVIHNFGYGGAMELYFYDGSQSVKMDEDTSAGSRIGVFLHSTSTEYYRVRNVSGSPIYICADGIVTK